ncbi:MAG: hypothetical protein ABIK28_09170, partial [Planctomycetota bacterium]
VVLAVTGKTFYIPLPDQHAHDDAFDHAHAHAENTISHTAWTENCEWFVELEMPIKGHDVCFAAHVTLLENFQPAKSGTFNVEAHSGSNTTETDADAPQRPGIFSPIIRFPAAGEWTLQLVFEDAGLKDSIDWNITVLDEEEQPEPEEEREGLISFWKEQQWKVPFGTAWVEKRDLAGGKSGLFVPASSIVENQTGKVVFVQVDGESFERRQVETGSSEGGKVESLSGLEGDERVVAKGVEHVKGT